ncbi:hypothetical protein N7462_004932 [Penicillium macrosclerotiorum]|uniref:uncharacterized protein n=1 Tax=Penicillium macrosclerotiorum TaxID=303699 RepID=UPI002546B395|nr:uncharacterized protein N7462_004932 [Penicillium macrosclerotiorum]KAJ5690540.1 hypothetical protein N7462_004932 [Penicillium macrosclerotiorum]
MASQLQVVRAVEGGGDAQTSRVVLASAFAAAHPPGMSPTVLIVEAWEKPTCNPSCRLHKSANGELAWSAGRKGPDT